MTRGEMTMRMAAVPIAAMLALASAAPAVAQDPGSRPTREFLQAATQADTFEITEGRAALTQSTDPRVRAFAQRMIQEHEGTGQALAQAASRAGLQPPPPNLSGDQAQYLGALQSLHGREFDQAYVRQQALAHRSALTVEQGYAANGDTPALRQVAADATPVIAAHLAMADQLRESVGGQ